MANVDQLKIIQQGVEAWNKWRTANPDDYVDLSGSYLGEMYLEGANLIKANLSGANLRKANLRGADLIGADLSMADLIDADLWRANLEEADLHKANLWDANLEEADLHKANLEEANLEEADLHKANLEEANLNGTNLQGAILKGANLWHAYLEEADLSMAYLEEAFLKGANLKEAALNMAYLLKANLEEADLTGAHLEGAYLERANLSGADLSMADLSMANLHGANLTDADLSAADLSRASLIETTLMRTTLACCRIYGVSAWGLKLDDKTEQRDLVITPKDQPTIRVDDIEVAQFVYFLLYNPNLRRVIDTITSRVVLILGSFADVRKPTLYAIKYELRKRGYVPIIYEFQGSTNRTTEETITLIARLARFVIADITDPRSIIQEISSITKEVPSVPIKPIMLVGCEPWGMYDHPQRYPWLLPLYEYRSIENLIASFDESVLSPLEGWLNEHLKLGSK